MINNVIDSYRDILAQIQVTNNTPNIILFYKMKLTGFFILVKLLIKIDRKEEHLIHKCGKIILNLKLVDVL